MSDARIGSEVAGYRIVSVLGQGGMGTVYLAEQTSPRRNVVVKLLRPDLSRDEAFRQRFVHESEATRELTTYPMAGPVVDVAVDQDTGTLWVLISDSGDANP
jgi:serine/threonine protein kinase